MASRGKVTATLLEQPYNFIKMALLKPSSDGKFFGKPIVLMYTTGASPSETISIYRWKSQIPALLGRIKTKRSDNVGSYVRAAVGPYLKGGKGTFELRGKYTMYSVCFKLTRTRQEVNGFPKR